MSTLRGEFDRAERMLRRAMYAEAELADLRASITALADEWDAADDEPFSARAWAASRVRALLGEFE